jgi:ATP-binding cassette subfamily B (MDR/TAP) protein 1
MNTGILMTVLWSVIFGAFSLGSVSPRIESFAKGIAACQNLFQVIDRVPPIDSLDPSGATMDEVKGRLELQGVTFKYPSRPEVTVLNNVSFTIPEGKYTAIVGVSGSGKSTIVQLLERFYDPNEGEILLDGVPLTSLNVGFLRSCMGLVSQEPVLFGTTVFENIIHGMVGTPLETASEQVKREAAVKACELAGIHSFVNRLPLAYDTLVGERGLLLSGGQKQRIAIARAIVSDPKILLLDEATSALDTISEREVQQALDDISESRTTVCVAHRLSTIRRADNIIVLSRGQVVEQGTHDELFAKRGLYHRLVEAQHLSLERAALSEPEYAEAVAECTESKESHPAVSKSGIVEDRNYRFFALVKRAFHFNRSEKAWLMLGWSMTLITGGVYAAQALIFSFSIEAFMDPDIPYMRSRANLFALCWVFVAIAEFFGYGIYSWSFGYSAERMARRVRFASFGALLRQDVAFFDRTEHSTGSLTSMLASDATSMSNFTGLGLGAVLTVLVGTVSGAILGYTTSVC